MNVRKKELVKEKIISENDPRSPRCVKILKLIDLMYDSNIPVGYWFLKMQDFKGSEQVKEIVLKYTESLKENYLQGSSICFSGNQGTGKTMSSICILKEALKKDFTSYYTTASDLMTEMTSNQKYVTRGLVRGADFLVVDEVDSRFFPSDSQKELFSGIYENVFRYRAHNQMPTIVCTNETDSLLNVFFGQAKQSIESLHSQYLKVYPAAGKDFRKTI